MSYILFYSMMFDKPHVKIELYRSNIAFSTDDSTS
jgi:hypothetical protein